MKKNDKYGFTLVELLAVIVILAIILVIAVPKVMSVIEDAKKATLESTVKMIASAAEKAKVQNTVLGKNEEITCESVAKINDIDYASCNITFENNAAKVTIEGSGKFDGLRICSGNKIHAQVQNKRCPVQYGIGSTYIEQLLLQEEALQNRLAQTTAEYNKIIYDAGIRYVGEISDVKNKVYYNCDETDTNGVSYGSSNYDYTGSCEVWRIIGVFEVENENGLKENRIKIINTASTFKASWDSSASDVNNGWGVNQWGESTLIDGSTYKGADLMQLLNGYYIGKTGAECKYCNWCNQEICSNVCTTESLKQSNMKPLTNVAKGMIDDAVWHTYASYWTTSAPTVYLQERGIRNKYTGCLYNEIPECTKDNVTRNNEWTGLVGLMSLSDMLYANGWLYNKISDIYSWSISPAAHSDGTLYVWRVDGASIRDTNAANQYWVFPSVYLKSDVEIIGGDGNEIPYKLK